MAAPAWNVSGQYYETCNCDFVCPCVPGQLAVRPTRGDCQFAMAFQIERGSFGAVSLDGLGFIILDTQRAFQTDQMYAWVVVLAGFGAACSLLFDRIERFAIPWHGR